MTGKEKDGSDTQSETAVTTSYANDLHIIVAAYNDDTNHDPYITYGPNSRKIEAGASLMGWSYSKDNGRTWTYGGKVAPSKGWAVLWGDPAITVDNGAYQYVFMSNLAIPNTKMPTNGSIEGAVIISGADSYLGGACIARSIDGGITFRPYQCVTNTNKNNVPNSEKGHFYDGGSMASSMAGEIYAGFVDMTTNQIDIWRSPSASGQFTMMPPPFPGMAIYSHPRIRVNRADGSVYVAAQATNGIIYINRFSGGAWGNAVQATDVGILYPDIKFDDGLFLRTGPQFSFDIGAASDENKSDAIRFLYTRKDPKSDRFYVTGSFCPVSLLPGCYPAPEWGTTPGNLNTPGDQFNPNVEAWEGFIGLPPAWKGTFLDRDGVVKNGVTLQQGNLAYLPGGTRIYVPFPIIKDQPICPDMRGYWGDYGDLTMIGFQNSIAQFMVTTSDSSLGCDKRWGFDSHNLHVRAVVFD